MKFENLEHEKTYKSIVGRMSYLDEYHKAVAYLLSLDNVLRKHIEDVFDFQRDCIKLEGLQKPWQTGTSKKTTRLAFNLWNSCCSDVIADDDVNAQMYSVSAIFSSCYAEYYFNAIRIRFGLLDE
jgi:hypothetical protein